MMSTKFVGHHISAGGFIFHKDKASGALSVLLIKNKKGEYWIPKGHIEDGEDHLVASFREIEEEVGIKKEQLKYIDFCNIHKFSFLDEDGNSNTKEIHMNVFEAMEKFEPKLEEDGAGSIQDADWFTFEDALPRIIPYSKDDLIKAREIFESFSARD